MSPDECRVADWYLIGELDARSGRTPAHFAQRDRACSEAGYAADQQSWREGWEHGLGVFCTPVSGFRFGREGGRYEPICPAVLEPEFLPAYDMGRRAYRLGERISGLQLELETADQRLSEHAKDGNLGEEQWAALQRQRRGLQDSLRAAEIELAELNGLTRGLGWQ